MSSSFCHPAHSAFNTPVNLAQEAFSLDYFFSRFPGLGWLRRNTPSESPNLTSMESQSDLDIIVFPERDEPEDSDGSIKARAEKSLPYSIISKGMLTKVRVGYSPCQKEAVKDSKNNIHSPVGKVHLRWYKKDKGLSHPETFFVVDRTDCLVILGATAFVNSNQPIGGAEIHPIGLPQQTAEERAELERRRKQAAERRALEKAEQEKKDAERRQQASQTT
ncbi:MAG: hypothetical protein LQ346_008599 [Caloplaca aetnensis]|nr:MAG: hypothetical protein LQ346_008599 [Caloplaca aetnensis]